MPVVPLTLAISLSLVFTFVLFYIGDRARSRRSSAERDSLLPLAGERRVRAEVGRTHPEA